MATFRARLRIHEASDPDALLLIHEADQPSYLKIWEMTIPELVYCAIVASGPDMYGDSEANAIVQMAPSTCHVCLNSGVESGTGLLAAQASRAVFGEVTGGHC